MAPRWFSSVLALAIAQPCWQTNVLAELRTLIGKMSRSNPPWGAPQIHGELLKLGFEVAQSTVARYKSRERVDAAPNMIGRQKTKAELDAEVRAEALLKKAQSKFYSLE